MNCGQDLLREAEIDIVGRLLTSDEGYRNLSVLCEEFGSRFGGTEGERLAIEYLQALFSKYGLENVHREEFVHNAWVRGPASLETLSPVSSQFKCISLPYSPSGAAEGELIYVGHGTPDDFEAAGDAIAGKIVMANAKSPQYYHRYVHRAEKLGRAIEKGAIGFIWMRWDPGLLEETGSTRWGRPCEIPCVGVSREVGETLLRLQKKGPVRVKIVTRDSVHPAPTANVVAEIRGRDLPDKVIIIGAHFDGHDIAPGAMDDGAGAMVVMEAARALANHKELVRKTLRFVLFPIEEIGLGGSYAYVAQHEAELDNVEFMLNLDGAGRSFAAPGLVLYGKWTNLFGFFKKIGSEMKQPFQVANGISLYSDHFPFQLKGIATGSVQEFSDTRTGVRGWGHTAADTLDKVSPMAIEWAAAFVARLVLRMSNRLDWPAKRKTEEEVQRELGEYMDVLRVEKRWPFGDFVAPIVEPEKYWLNQS